MHAPFPKFLHTYVCCLRALRQQHGSSITSSVQLNSFTTYSPLQNPPEAQKVDNKNAEALDQIVDNVGREAKNHDSAPKQGAMSRRLEQATEDALMEGGRAGRRTIEAAGFSEELKARLLERVEAATFKSEHASALAEAEIGSNAGRGTRDIASAQAWTGTESTEDAVLRMLNDAHNPLKPGSRGSPKLPVIDLRPRRESKRTSGQRLANARDKTSVYAISKDAAMTDKQRDDFRAELKERFAPGAGAMPNTFRGLAALANERIEDAIARGQFKNIPRGKAIERDPRADNPFIDTTEYILNKMIQRQDIMPPWIEKQQELVKTANTFRGRLRNDWKRHVARTIASKGGNVTVWVKRAEAYRRAEEKVNPKRRKTEDIALPTAMTDDPVMVKLIQEASATEGEISPLLKFSIEKKDREVPITASDAHGSSTPEMLSETKLPPQEESLPAPFRDPTWVAAEQSYLNLAISNLNSITRSYNLMAPDLAKKPYYSLERELNACYADVAPLVAEEILERARRPEKVLAQTVRHREGGVLERFAGEKVNVYDDQRKAYGWKEFWSDLRGKGDGVWRV
jgi:hypothetical protein